MSCLQWDFKIFNLIYIVTVIDRLYRNGNSLGNFVVTGSEMWVLTRQCNIYYVDMTTPNIIAFFGINNIVIKYYLLLEEGLPHEHDICASWISIEKVDQWKLFSNKDIVLLLTRF